MTRERYARQLVLPQFGEAGQAALADASVTLIGCGGLGTVAAAYLAGAGVGRLVLVDHDRVELSNLHRQILFRESDIGQPKAAALAAALQERNPESDYAAVTTPADADSLPNLIGASDLVLDCSDNFPTRYAINAACVQRRIPLLSAAAIRLDGLVLALLPGRREQACYHCVFPQSPQHPSGESCQDAGVLGPSVGVVASQQASQALAILTGRGQFNRLWRWDGQTGELRVLGLRPDARCPVCAAAAAT